MIPSYEFYNNTTYVYDDLWTTDTSVTFDLSPLVQVSAAGRADGLEGALQLDQCQIPVEEWERLDQGLAHALQHLTLPPGWSLLGGRGRGGAGEAGGGGAIIYFFLVFFFTYK